MALLSCTLNDLKEKLRKVHKNSMFWCKVSKILADNEVDYSPNECKKSFPL